jgi:hypothetical protein
LIQAGAHWALATILTLGITAGRAAADGNEDHQDGRHDDRRSAITVKATGGGDYTTIQDAIDAASPGDTIAVYPGDYLERASNRTVLDGTPQEIGTYQFGLFISQDRDGITIEGVDDRGRRIKDFRKVEATVITDATNDFGPSGIFVEGDGVTISGLEISVNLVGQNKTIEVIGDDFALVDCDISDLDGSVYLNDWRFDVPSDTSHLRAYRIDGNHFQDGVSLDVASGAGYSGRVKGRVIRANKFDNSNSWPAVSFNGSDTGVPWFVQSVGGAVIEGNSFVNTFVSTGPSDLDTEGHIRARGTYDNSQFDWKSYWNENKYNRAFVVGPKPPKELRTYSYTRAGGGFTAVFNDVRRIGALLAGEQKHQQPGDKILSK